MRLLRMSMMAATSVLAMVSTCAQDRATPFRKTFEPVVARTLDDLEIPGLAVVVADRDGVIYRHEWGVQDLRSPVPLTSRSLFHVASLTKTFTATGILRLVESGGISLDDPVARYLPYFGATDSLRTRITVRMLLSHTSGLPDIRDFGWDAPETDAAALERTVRDTAADPLVVVPGEEFHYSNLGYSVLGDLLAKVLHRDYESAMREMVLEPCGMSRSSLLLEDVADRAELTAPHVLDATYHVAAIDVRPYSRPHAPSSTLYASTEDMAMWIPLHLRQGEGDHPLLSPQMYALMWTPHVGTDGQMGLGWFLGDREGLATVSHSGGDLGYAAYLILVPDRGVGVAVLSNYERTPVQALAEVLLDITLGHEPDPLPPTAGLQLDRLLYREFQEAGVEGATRRYRELATAEQFDFDQVRQMLGLARVFRDGGRADFAAATYGYCIELYPEFAWLHELRAVALVEANDTQAAATEVRRALELNPESDRARRLAVELDLHR